MELPSNFQKKISNFKGSLKEWRPFKIKYFFQIFINALSRTHYSFVGDFSLMGLGTFQYLCLFINDQTLSLIC